jgi:hypothetical protein
MSTRDVAELQAVLEGVPLPTSKRELLDYAWSQDGYRFTELLARLPDREFRSLDEVGEALFPVQPEWREPGPHEPKPESGRPPGGLAYTDASAEPGRVREDGPE